MLDKVSTIQESGVKHDESRGSGAGVAAGVEPLQSVDLLQLFDPMHSNISSSSNKASNGRNGGMSGTGAREGQPAATSGGVTANSGGPLLKYQQQQSQQLQVARTQQPTPPPPYDTAIQDLDVANASIASEPPPYLEALAAEGQLVNVVSREAVRDVNNGSRSSMVSPGTRITAGGGLTEELIELTPGYDDAGPVGGRGQQEQRGHGAAGTDRVEAWWEAPAAVVRAAGSATTQKATRQRHPPLGPGSIRNDSISCTRSTSLSEYSVDLAGVLRAAMGGGVLSSNARLLCVCCAGPAPEMVNAEAGGVSNATTLKGCDSADACAQQDVGHVSVLDLWHRGRTVRYPTAADRAAMSPNQSESVIAVHGGGSLHVFSIPRRCRLQELAVATELCMWR